jgi:hypothetical protein
MAYFVIAESLEGTVDNRRLLHAPDSESPILAEFWAV